ncbi:MAG: CapA family protein, partial [Ktedonobacterales bacterium]
CVSSASATAGLRGKPLATLADSLAAALAGATQTLDMVAVGDIMLGRGVNNQMVGRNDYLFPYRGISDELHPADFRVANLECMITDLVAPPTDPSTFTFISAKKAVDGLVYAGFDTVTLANNHANGEGPVVFQDMRDTLHSHNMLTCGGGKNLAEARTPAIKTVKGVRIAILGYDTILPQGPFATATTWGLAPIDAQTLPADIAAARQQADLVIPYFHWGIEYTKDPTPAQQTPAHVAIDAGADMVLGNHPHWIQGIETYKGKLIIYSMGNFIFDQDWSEATLEGMLLHLYWRGKTLTSVRFVATKDVSRCQPRPMTAAEAVGAFSRLWSGTDLLANGQYGPEYEP